MAVTDIMMIIAWTTFHDETQFHVTEILRYFYDKLSTKLTYVTSDKNELKLLSKDRFI